MNEQIDFMVYVLYRLTQKEIEFIEKIKINKNEITRII